VGVDVPLRGAEVTQLAAEMGIREQQHVGYEESSVHLNVVSGLTQLAEKVLGHGAQPYERPLFHVA
jgi:hypothetical protein